MMQLRAPHYTIPAFKVFQIPLHPSCPYLSTKNSEITRCHHRSSSTVACNASRKNTPSKATAAATETSDIEPSVTPIQPPPALKLRLLNVVLPEEKASVDDVWRAMISDTNNLLVAFHKAMGDTNITLCVKWEELDPEVTVAVELTYSTPISSPIPWAPKVARNTERLDFVYLGSRGFVVSCKCETEGVPLCDTFANYLQWVVEPVEGGGAKIKISAETRFHGKIPAPIKFAVQKESKQGMTRGYSHLPPLLEEEYNFPRCLGPTLRPLLKDVSDMPSFKAFCNQRWPAWARERYWIPASASSTTVANDRSMYPTPTQALEILVAMASVGHQMRFTERVNVFTKDALFKGLVECLRLVPTRAETSNSTSVAMELRDGAGNNGKKTKIKRNNNKNMSTKSGKSETNASDVVVEGGDDVDAATETENEAQQQQRDDILPPSHICDAINVLGFFGNESYFEQEMEALCQRLPEITVDDCSVKKATVALWGLSAARHWTPNLYCIEQLLVELIQNSDVLALSNRVRISASVEKMAYFGYRPDKLFDTISEAISTSKYDDNGLHVRWPPQGLARISWALAITDALDSSLCLTVLQALVNMKDLSALKSGHFCMLQQLFLSLQLRRPAIWAQFKEMLHNSTSAATIDALEHQQQGVLIEEDSDGSGSDSSTESTSLVTLSFDDDDTAAVLPTSLDSSTSSTNVAITEVPETPLSTAMLIEQAEKCWEDLMSWDKNVSSAQNDTFNALKGLGYSVELEPVILGASVDMAAMNIKLAVEVDGPHHYTRNLKDRLVGNLLWKKRLLTSAGWKVLNVDAFAFARLRYAERKKYLQQRLEKLLME